MMIRYGTAIFSGCAVTISLLWLMQSLISLSGPQDTTTRARHELGFGPLLQDEPVVPEDLSKKYEELKDPVDTAPQRPFNPDGNGQPGYFLDPPPAPRPGDFRDRFGVNPDGPLVTIVRVQPVYPVRATELNLEGFVIVEFDVTTAGTVANIRIIESSHRIFEKPAINATLKFRYKPRVIDGVAQTSTGIRNVFRFEMERT